MEAGAEKGRLGRANIVDGVLRWTVWGSAQHRIEVPHCGRWDGHAVDLSPRATRLR